MGFFTDNNCCKKCILVLTVILTVSSAVFYIFSDNFAEENVRNLDSIAYSEESTRHRVNNVQTRRLSLVTSVCNKYRNDTTHKYLYVDKPGSKIRGKFTFEPKSKLVLCNIMKQGTTTWARTFIQLYLPNAANWRASKWQQYSPFNVGYQVKLRELENKMFTNSRKQKILRSLDDPNHEYFAFFVCRNPIERLKSLYSYSLDLGRFKGGLKPKNLKDFILKVFKKNPTFAYNSMFSLCSPCTRHYNAVIKMETFSEDSRYILRQRGRDKQVHVSHSNNHGSQTVKKEEVMKLFKGIPSEVIDNLVRRLRPDFELCGYNKTLQWIMELNKRS